MTNIQLITNEKNWMEDQAIEQLKAIAQLPGVVKAVGLPDLHPGNTPVGSAVITLNRIYPHLVGNDIGCGMGLFKTDIEMRKLNKDRAVKKMERIQSFSALPLQQDVELPDYNPIGERMGTIGGGNHFLELQETHEVFEPERFEKLGLDRKKAMILVHSGSRNYGQQIVDALGQESDYYRGYEWESEKAQEYMEAHQKALQVAAGNRKIAVSRIAQLLGLGKLWQVIDIPHNYLEPIEMGEKLHWIHRKGAAPTNRGAVVIPGSRGALTYLAMPTENTEIAGDSLAHGAGRKWERSRCKVRLQRNYTREELKTTRYKSRVICGELSSLYEEAPEAYKNIHTIIEVLKEWGLIHVIATFKPLITYKG